MVINTRHSLVSAAMAAVCLGAVCTPAAAQSLALSYKLDPANAPQSAKTAGPVDRCAGLSWWGALTAGCAARVLSPAAAADALAAPVGRAAEAVPSLLGGDATYSVADAQPRRLELPLLGSGPAEPRLVRMAGGKDDYIGNARNVDVNFRFGSKYRMRSGEDGSFEVYKFKDVTSENRIGSSGLKNLGVELLFPFH